MRRLRLDTAIGGRVDVVKLHLGGRPDGLAAQRARQGQLADQGDPAAAVQDLP